MPVYIDNVIISGINQVQFELVYTSSFLLLDKNDFMSIFFNDKLFNWQVHIDFPNNPSVQIGDVKMRVEEPNRIFLTHTNWYGDDWLSYSNPFIVNSKDNKTILHIMVRSLATSTQNKRVVEITVWKELPKTTK